MLSAEYHLKQAQVAARLALAERDPAKAARFRLLVLEQFEKAKEIGVNEPIPALTDEAQHQLRSMYFCISARPQSSHPFAGPPSHHDD